MTMGTRLTLRAQFLFLWALTGCSGDFVAPCAISAEKLVVHAPGPAALVPRRGEGPLLVQCLDPLTPSSTAHVVELSPDGDVVASHAIPLPPDLVPIAPTPGPMPGPPFPLPLATCSWTNDGLVLISLRTDDRSPGEDPASSALVFRRLDAQGIVQSETLLPTGCADCTLSWSTVSLGSRLALLVSATQVGALTQSLWLLDLEGRVVREAKIDAITQGPVALRLTGRGDLGLTGNGQHWLLGDELEAMAGPIVISAEAHALVAWNLAGSSVTAAWASGERHLLYRRFSLDGSELREVDRLSRADLVLAVHSADEIERVAFMDEGALYLAVATAAGHKLGGDIALATLGPPPIGFGTFAQVLLSGGGTDTQAFVHHPGGTSWLEVTCAE
jgi:hypothetical protein